LKTYRSLRLYQLGNENTVKYCNSMRKEALVLDLGRTSSYTPYGVRERDLKTADDATILAGGDRVLTMQVTAVAYTPLFC